MAQALIDFFTFTFNIPCIAIVLLIVSQLIYFFYDLKVLKRSDSHLKDEISILQDKISKLEEEKAYLIGVVELNGKLVD